MHLSTVMLIMLKGFCIGSPPAPFLPGSRSYQNSIINRTGAIPLLAGPSSALRPACFGKRAAAAPAVALPVAGGLSQASPLMRWKKDHKINGGVATNRRPAMHITTWHLPFGRTVSQCGIFCLEELCYNVISFFRKKNTFRTYYNN